MRAQLGRPDGVWQPQTEIVRTGRFGCRSLVAVDPWRLQGPHAARSPGEDVSGEFGDPGVGAEIAVLLDGRCPGSLRDVLVDGVGDRHADGMEQPLAPLSDPGDEVVGAASGVGVDQGPAAAQQSPRGSGRTVMVCMPRPSGTWHRARIESCGAEIRTMPSRHCTSARTGPCWEPLPSTIPTRCVPHAGSKNARSGWTRPSWPTPQRTCADSLGDLTGPLCERPLPRYLRRTAYMPGRPVTYVGRQADRHAPAGAGGAPLLDHECAGHR